MAPQQSSGQEMTSILTPVLALVILSLVVWIWMYAVRLPAIQRAGLNPQDVRFPAQLNVLPDGARQVADNYNHLMEQPTIFYALIFYIYLSGGQDQLYIWLAWAYVGLRVMHTLIQSTINVVALRFSVFSLSTLVLMAMAVRALMALA